MTRDNGVLVYWRPLDVVDGGRVERASDARNGIRLPPSRLPSAWSAVKTVFRSVQCSAVVQLQRPVSVFVFDEEAGLHER